MSDSDQSVTPETGQNGLWFYVTPEGETAGPVSFFGMSKHFCRGCFDP